MTPVSRAGEKQLFNAKDMIDNIQTKRSGDVLRAWTMTWFVKKHVLHLRSTRSFAR